MPLERGFEPDDFVFAPDGSFYFSDFHGTAGEPTGGVFHASKDRQRIHCVLPNIGQANGLALSADGRTLWVTEYAKNRLHRLEFAVDGETLLPTGSTVAYYFTGPAPDSLRMDSDGNVYVAMHRQGRFLVFNPHGLPIGQILIPGRDSGSFLKSTSLAIEPETNDPWLLAADGTEGTKAAVFHAKVFAHGPR